jgi:hypothetical protein
MAQCFTVAPQGRARGIPVVRVRTDGEWGAPHIRVGGLGGRGRKLVRVPLPAGAEVEWAAEPADLPEWWGTLCRVPGTGTIILFRDLSGHRGSWTLSVPPSATVIAEGWSIAGRAGGGPEYLVRALDGAEFSVRRTGCLYGAPRNLRVTVHPDRLEVTNLTAEAESAEAAARWGVDLGREE